MKAVVNHETLEFSDVTALYNHIKPLIFLSEHEHMSSPPLQITIEDNNLSAAQLDKMVWHLLEYPAAGLKPYSLKINDSHRLAGRYNRIFLDLSLLNQRHQYTLQADNKQQPLHSNSQPPEAKLRKSKVNLVRDIAPAGMQIQQQQQQQQQQETTQTAKKRKTKVKDTSDKESDNHHNLPNSVALGTLVSKGNIYSVLRDFNEKQHPDSQKRPDLGKVWESLVGEGADQIAIVDYKITKVQLEAMQQIISHHAEFAFGICPDNLPAGFYLQKTNDNQQVLCYSNKLELQHKQTLTPLTLHLDIKPPLHYGTYQQFLLSLLTRKRHVITEEVVAAVLAGNTNVLKNNFGYLNAPQYEKQFLAMVGDNVSLTAKKEAFLFFLREITHSNEKILNAVTSFTLDLHHYQGLAALLVNCGEYGVIHVLQQIQKLKDNGIYAFFNTIFLDNSDNYLQFINPKGKKNLEKLMMLDSNQRNWWESLVKQHKDAGARADFIELSDAFFYFLDELNKLGIKKLPPSCPMSKIKHMKTALDRALFIMTNAADSKEQLSCLDGLDFGSNGAYLACRFHHYVIVSKEMKLSPEAELGYIHHYPESIALSADISEISVGHATHLLAINLSAKKLDPNLSQNAHAYEHFSTMRRQMLQRRRSIFPEEATNRFSEDVALYAVHFPLWRGFLIAEHHTEIGISHKLVKHHEVYSFYDRDYNRYFRQYATCVNTVAANRFLEPGILTYTPPSRASLFNSITFSGDIKEYNLEQAMRIIYRFLGKQSSAYPLETYQHIEQMIRNKPQLTRYDQAHLFALVVLCTTGNAHSDHPILDTERVCKAFDRINKILIPQGTSCIDYFNLLGFAAISLETMSVDNANSLSNVAEMMEFICSDETNLNKYTLVDSIHFLVFYTNPPHRLTQTLEALKTRAELAAENPTRYTYSNHGKSLGVLASLRRKLFHKINSNDSENCKDFADHYILMIAALAEHVSEHGDKRVKKLTEQVLLLKPDLRKLCVSLIADINVRKSAELPAIHDVISFLKEVQHYDFKDRTEDMQRQILQDKIRQQFPKTTFGNEPINESLNALVDVFKGYFGPINLPDLLDEKMEREVKAAITQIPMVGAAVFETLKKEMDPIKVTALQLHQCVVKEAADMSEILGYLHTLDQQLAALMGKSILGVSLDSSIVTNIITSFTGPEASPLIKQFIEKKSLIVLMKEPLEQLFKGKLNNSIKLLQTGSESLNQWVLQQLGEIIPDQSIDHVLTAYSQRFKQVNEFMNQLIRIKNRDATDFKKLVKFLNDKDHLHTIPFVQLSPLLIQLNQHPKLPVAVQFNAIIDIIKEHPAGEIKHAVEQLAAMVALRDVTKPEAYKALLKASFKYNLTNKNGQFPLKELAALKSLNHNDNEEADDLFKNIIALVEQAKPEAPPTLVADTISQAVKKITELSPAQPDVVAFFNHTIGCCKHRDKNDFASLQQLIKQLPGNPKAASAWLKIMAALSAANRGEDGLRKLIKLQTLLDKHNNLLSELASLFQFKPSPSLDTLIAKLENKTLVVQKFISEFDHDPCDVRKAEYDSKGKLVATQDEVTQRQFTTDRVKATVAQINTILEHSALSGTQQYELTQQVLYINALGKGRPFSIGNKECADLTKASRMDLHHYANILFQQLRTPGFDPEATKKTQLMLLAVLRETYFRTTGKLPQTTQLLSLLLSLNHPGNVLMEINTGEGKSITTALLAVLQWAQGGTVDVCTANRGLVSQDYHDKGNAQFFSTLGIASAVVRADSESGTYQTGGINYSTVADLSIYRSRAHIGGEQLSRLNGKTLANHLILDESDYTTLDDRTLFNYAIGAEGNSTQNPYAWIYPLINEFVTSSPFKKLTATTKDKAWTSTEDVQELKKYLDERATVAQRNQLLELSDKKFDKWLDAACIAQQQREGEHFIIGKETRVIDDAEISLSVAVPLIHKTNPQYGASFSEGVQQFLHARLQKESKSLTFPIDAELLFVASESAKGFIDHYHRNGRILGISGTVGTDNELIEQHHKFGFTSLSVPPHQKNKRKIGETRYAKNDATQLAEIKKVISDVVVAKKPTQPILLIAKDINEARQLYNLINSKNQKFNGKTLKVNLVTGEEPEKKRHDLIEAAGQPNQITIATSLLGRGTDITPQHEDGLFVIQSYLDTERTTKQILGRSGRNGTVGKYIAIYNENGLPHRYALDSLLTLNKEDRKRTITALQRQINEEHAVERHYLQETSHIQKVILEQFDHWQQFLELNTRGTLSSHLKKELLALREELIVTLAHQWKHQLETSDPEKKYSNPYVRRNDQLQLDTSALNKALNLFEKDATQLWQDVASRLYERAKIDSLDETNRFRAQYMKEMNVSELLKLNKLAMREDKKNELNLQKRNKNHVNHAMDVDGALLKYGNWSEKELTGLKDSSLRTQLSITRSEFNNLIRRLPLKQSTKNSLLLTEETQGSKRSLSDQLGTIVQGFVSFNSLFSDNLAIKYQMQGPLIEFLAIYKHFQGRTEFSRVIPSLQKLKNSYLDDVTLQIANDLENTLSWAAEGNQSWDHWLERSAVQRAAQDILNATDALSKAQNPKQHNERMRNLYKVLHTQKIKLNNVWIFSFGHQNIRKTIDNAMNLIDGMEHIADIPLSFRNEVREEAVRELHIETFDALLHEVNTRIPNHLKKQWITITNELNTIKNENDTLYVFYELHLCLQRYQRADSCKPLLNYIKQMQHGLKSNTFLLEEQHQDLLLESRFLAIKQEQLKTAGNRLQGVFIDDISLTRGHTGFNEFYTLTIKGAGSPELFSEFTRYNNHTALLEERLRVLRERKKPCEEHTKEIQDLLLQIKNYEVNNSDHKPMLALTWLDEHLQKDILQCNYHLLLLNNDGVPSPATTAEKQLSAETQGLIKQYHALQQLSFENINEKTDQSFSGKLAEQLKRYVELKKDLQSTADDFNQQLDTLRAQRAQLQSAREDNAKPRGFRANLSHFGRAFLEQTGLVRTVESLDEEIELVTEQLALTQFNRRDFIDDYRQDKLTFLKGQELEVKAQIKKDLSANRIILAKKLMNIADATQEQMIQLDTQINSLTVEFEQEQSRSGVMSKQFATLAEVLEFESKMRVLPKRAVAKTVPVALKNPENDNQPQTRGMRI